MRGVEQSLGRDAAAKPACAAEPRAWFFLDDRGFQTELSGTHGGDVTARSGAYDDDVKLFSQ